MNENLKRMFSSVDRGSRKRIALEQSWKMNCSRPTIPEHSFKTIALLAGCSVEEVKEYFEAQRNSSMNDFSDNDDQSSEDGYFSEDKTLLDMLYEDQSSDQDFFLGESNLSTSDCHQNFSAENLRKRTIKHEARDAPSFKRIKCPNVYHSDTDASSIKSRYELINDSDSSSSHENSQSEMEIVCENSLNETYDSDFVLNGMEDTEDFLIDNGQDLSESSNIHLQKKPCYISPYDRFDACISCLPSSEEQCRFQNFRVFNQFSSDKSYPRICFSSNNKPLPKFTYNNIISSDKNDQYIRKTIASTFRNILLKEHYHLKTFKNVMICRVLESDIRHLCDHCVTTIFNGYWMCSFCGTEICLDCYSEWDDFSKSRCKKGRVHNKENYFPISHLTQHDVQILLDSVSSVISKKKDKTNENLTRSHILQTKWIDGEMDIDQFQYMWKIGHPFMISGFYEKLTHRLWTPKYFSKQFGDTICSCIDVVTKTSRKLKVGDFFSGFSYSSQNEKGKNRGPCLKIKDWPPNEDFAKAFPLHFNDFMFALPFKRYTHRNGAFNLSARLPPKTNPPDLGPKMYNAYGSTDEVGGKGTTNLHLDMTDAVNLMAYATPPEQRSKYERQFLHAAVWDIYKMDDLPLLCKFLRKVARERGVVIDHPIHDQCFYLDEALRKRLLKEYGIKGVRIYQNPGDVVFVPAGCAHQVCNFTSCIKVALDFVSPEGVERSYKITRQFRKLMPDHKRKEDILQLSNILFHTWITVNSRKGFETKSQNKKSLRISQKHRQEFPETSSRTSRNVIKDLQKCHQELLETSSRTSRKLQETPSRIPEKSPHNRCQELLQSSSITPNK
ncbi:16443_t:CDS:2 [Cetraspora pellucida]|uniref:16443_t:CDS:1 n=1 Tax=Cetraspora pellucida TaxID=1433469 RepID=A0A9N9CE90_9GLOM|nr:16443_t:CDS:2 [Cetraspora pellucida]